MSVTDKLIKWVKTHKHETILIVLYIVYFIYFNISSFLRYDNFITGRFDLGNMVQTVWNTINGRIFSFTNPYGTAIISRLAFHADFILILLAPFYAVWPHPYSLLFIQTTIVGAGSFFVFLIAKEILKNKNIALTFAFAYLLNPAVERTNLYDFHAVALATTFLLITFYFYLKKKYKYFIIFAVLSAICKEQIWVIISLFGILLFFQQKKRLLGSAIFIIPVIIFYILIWHMIPSALGSQHFALSYYSDFGDSPAGIINSVLLSPHKILSIVLQPDRVQYLIQIFSPLGFLSLLSPFFLLFMLPDLLINLLSSNQLFRELYYHYTAVISPFLFIAAIQTIHMLKKRFPKISINLFIYYLLAASLCASYFYGPLPGAYNADLDMFTNPIPNKNFINEYLSRIPAQYSVSATNIAGSHLAQRQKIYNVPLGINEADFIVLLRIGDPEKDIIKKINTQNYALIVNKDNFRVYKKIKI